MSTSRHSNSGVRNLRAVFEQNLDPSISPPYRGRSSSATSFTSNGNSDKSPNPSITRKIKANFVSVEPSGHLRRPSVKSTGDMENGNDITTQQRRESFSLSEEQDGDSIAELKRTMEEEIERRKNSIPALPEIVPEEAMFSDLPTPIPGVNEDKDNAGQLGLWVAKTAYMKEQTAASGQETSSKECNFQGSMKSQSQPKKTPVKVNGIFKVNGSATKTSSAKPKTLGNRPSLTASTSSSKPLSPKSTGIAASKTKSKTTPEQGHQRSPMGTIANGITDAQEKVKKSTTRLASQSNTQSSPQISRKSRIASPPSKSRPKSPTRPLAISSHLTAPTASSQAKHERPPTALSKESTAPSSKPIGTSSHLMAPTTASAAKHEQPVSASDKTSRASTGKSNGLSSHLMAPTASSTAKHDGQLLALASTSTHPAAGADKPVKPTASTRDWSSVASKSNTTAPTAIRKPSYSTRTSHASNNTHGNGNSTGKRPESRTATTALASTSKRSAPPRAGFLDRMTRPTAALTKRLEEKAEHKAEGVKSPPHRGRAGSVKANGVPGKKAMGPMSREKKVKLGVGAEEEKTGHRVNGATTKDELAPRTHEPPEENNNAPSEATDALSVARPMTPEIKKMEIPVTPEAKIANVHADTNGLTNGDMGSALLNGEDSEDGADGEMATTPALLQSPIYS